MKPEHVGDRLMAVLAWDAPAPERIVLAAIAYHDGPGGAHPTAETIGARVSMSERNVRRRIASAMAKGMLTKRKGQRGDHYAINYAWTPDRAKVDRSENFARHGSDRAKVGRQTGQPLPAEWT